MILWSPKAPLDFRALIEEPTAAGSYRKLNFPTLLLRGQHAPLPTRIVAQGLASLLPKNRLITIKGAGHMGPLTHAPQVSALIVQHIAATETGLHAPPPQSRHPRGLAEIFDAVSRTAQVWS